MLPCVSFYYGSFTDTIHWHSLFSLNSYEPAKMIGVEHHKLVLLQCGLYSAMHQASSQLVLISKPCGKSGIILDALKTSAYVVFTTIIGYQHNTLFHLGVVKTLV